MPTAQASTHRSKNESERLSFAKNLALAAGELGMGHFRKVSELIIEQKGAQDLVSNADKELEQFIRGRIAAHFPDDGIVGEEYDNVEGSTGYTWVIDPIDGTANFVCGIPAWCVILACVHEEDTVIGVIFEPSYGELFWTERGLGAYLNDVPMRVAESQGLHEGSIGLGMNGRTPKLHITRLMPLLFDKGGVFFRNASGGLMLSYVASGRLIGYIESHMNAYDCLAGQLLIDEAGGVIERQNAQEMLIKGGRVVASTPAIFEQLVNMADAAFQD